MCSSLRAVVVHHSDAGHRHRNSLARLENSQIPKRPSETRQSLSATKEFTVFGEDYGTSELKFGPATLGNVPDVLENRGYFPDTRSSVVRMTAGPLEEGPPAACGEGA